METMKPPGRTLPHGIAPVIAAMEDYQRMEIGRQTLRFFWRCIIRNPGLREQIQTRAAEIRTEEETRRDKLGKTQPRNDGATVAVRLGQAGECGGFCDVQLPDVSR